MDWNSVERDTSGLVGVLSLHLPRWQRRVELSLQVGRELQKCRLTLGEGRSPRVEHGTDLHSVQGLRKPDFTGENVTYFQGFSRIAHRIVLTTYKRFHLY